MFDLSGKVALITGSSRGIGQAIALKLGQQGATIIGTATSIDGANKITQFLEENNLKGNGICVDFSLPANEYQEQLKALPNQIDILINNEGITRDNLFMRMKDEEWEDVLHVNLDSIFYLTRSLIRQMLKTRYGRIINITSIVGVTGNAGQINYASAKAGMIGFSKALAQEVASRNITVNCIAPGFIDTDMTKALSDDQRSELLKRVPANRLGSVDDIANSVLFLASQESGYITGTTLHVNGGMYM